MPRPAARAAARGTARATGRGAAAAPALSRGAAVVAPAAAGPRWQQYQLERARGAGRGVRRFAFGKLHAAAPLNRASLVKQGAPASLLTDLAEALDIPKERLYLTIGVARATADRKVREDARLDPDATERALGLARLVGQVEQMVRESGDPDTAPGFDAARWVADFLAHPHPALGGRRPGDLMDTADGRGVVSDLVAQMQSGAYA